MIVGDGLARPVLYNGARMLVTDQNPAGGKGEEY